MISTDDVYKLILDSENILIGAGSGLSAAAGMLYLDKGFFDRCYPGYSERYGLSYTYEAAFHEYPTPEEHYTFWARHIRNIRINYPVGDVYKKLLKAVKNKNHFVISTNCDGQFEKAGFDREKLFTTQGDYAFFQCSKPCSDEIYPNSEWVNKMLDGLTDADFAGSTDNIPYCPKCGELLVPNLRKDNTFVEAPWMEKQDDYIQFVNENRDNLLLLEFGVGFNTPTIIRLPFEQLAAQMKGVKLVRVNQDTRLHVKGANKRYYPVNNSIEYFFQQM